MLTQTCHLWLQKQHRRPPPPLYSPRYRYTNTLGSPLSAHFYYTRQKHFVARHSAHGIRPDSFPTQTTHQYIWRPPFVNMSVLPAEVHGALDQVLQALQNTDNTVRSQAEKTLNDDWINQRPDMLLMGLAEQMQGSQDEGVSRTFTRQTRGDAGALTMFCRPGPSPLCSSDACRRVR